MTTTTKLTHAQIIKAKAKSKDYKLFDGNGLYLFVSRAGGKIWRITYRINGKAQTFVIGPYPVVTLAEAREQSLEVRRKVFAGVDPRAPKRAAKMTFAEAFEKRWLHIEDALAERTAYTARNCVNRYAMKPLGHKPLDTISQQDVLDVLNVLNDAKLYPTVRKLRNWIGQVFVWGLAQGQCTTNPCALIAPKDAFGRRKTRNQSALPQEELGTFMARLADEDQNKISVVALKILMYTGVRTIELRGMQWKEINGDLWTIPADRMKMRREHLVPLPSQVVSLLAEWKARQLFDSEFVFPNLRSPFKMMSENTVLKLVWQMGFKDVMTGHGCRSMFSTWAHESGMDHKAIERQLAHVPAAELISNIYNKAQYLPQRRIILQAWADRVASQFPQRPVSSASILQFAA